VTPPNAQAIVADAAGAAAADAAAIAGGVPSRALMQRAGAAATAEIAHRYPELLNDGVVIATGGGNNGGDGWVIAAALHAVGIPARVVECAAPATPDARAERAAALAAGVPHSSDVQALAEGGERLIVDALLGTGFSVGAPLRGAIASAVALLRARAEKGATLVAIDVPSGLDATTGRSEGDLRAALTLTFGTIKRGQLIARECCGAIIALDIGLGANASAAGSALLADASWFRRELPSIPADAHKGTRKRIAIVGGATGMAGAAILAARAALRSGAGLVKCFVASESVQAVQEAVPEALAAPWPSDAATFAERIGDWADAVLVGPGLGRPGAREMVQRLFDSFDGPMVLDADALNAFEHDAAALMPWLRDRAALLTPHPAEFARLAGASVDDILAERFTWPARLAAQTSACVLLKGVPTIVSAPSGHSIVVAEGTPILATGGAGDLLGGIAVTLLAQTGDACRAGALAAFAHGRAAADVSARAVRGYTLDDVLLALPTVWALEAPARRPPVLAELPAVGETPR
jgi:ADP-dependent NAD(P)H-hydrate dehydratase / NAD(P)H-hydrate epimerase